MTFLTPALALGGLLAVSIPIIIHLLFRQRRRPIEWAAMRFLMEAFRKFRRRLQMEQWLLLLIRCLIVAALGLALARPLLQQAGFLDLGGSRSVYLVIDDGLASHLTDEQGQTALKRHIDHAIEIVRRLHPADTVGIITAARPARAIVSPPSSNHSGVIDLLRSLEPSAAETDLPAALELLDVALKSEQARQDQSIAYLLSEFRAGSAALDVALPRMEINEAQRITLLAMPPAVEVVGNIQITAIDPVRRLILPGQQDGWSQVRVRLARVGGELDAEITRVQLSGDDIALIEPRTVQWSPGQTDADLDFNIELAVTGERDLGLTASIDADRLEADNARHAVLSVRRGVRVVLIERRDFAFDRQLDDLTAGRWIRLALEPFTDSPLQFVDVEPASLAPVDLRAADVALLARPDLMDISGWQALAAFYERGGLIIVTPPAEQQVHQWVDQFAEQFNLPWQIEKEFVQHPDGLALALEQPRDPLLRLVSSELPDLTAPVFAWRTLPIDRASARGRVVLQFADQSPMLLISGDTARSAAAEGETDNAARESEVDMPQGLIALFAMAPELTWTNLPTKPLMVPLFHELVRQGLSDIRAQREVLVGTRRGVSLPRPAADLIGPDGERMTVGEAGRPQQPLQRAGLYEIVDAVQQSLGRLAVNIRSEAADTAVQDVQAVEGWLRASGPWQTLRWQPDDGTSASSLDLAGTPGSPLARLILLLVLLLLIFETLLARWFSHAWRPGTRMASRGLDSSLDEQRSAALTRPLATGDGGS